MRIVLSFAFLAGTVFAQLPAGVAPAPAAPQAPARADLSKIPDNQEIVRIDGQPFTMGQYRALLQIVAPANQAMATVDPGAFIMQIALMRKLADMATQQKLDQQSPTKEQLEYVHLSVLMQAELSQLINAPVVHQEEIEAFYNANRDRFKQVKLKAIKIAFGGAGSVSAAGKKPLTEAEAKAKAEKVVASIRGGADFVKMVRENSDDDALKARDGDFQTVTPTDNFPAEFLQVVFQLKPGQVSDPIKEGDGYFYILKAEEVTYKPLTEVQTDVYHDLKQQMGQAAIEKIRKDLNVQFTNPEFPKPTK